MSGMDSFRDVIDKWPSRDEMADDLGEKVGTIHKWYARDRIPSEKWSALVEAGKKRRIKITIQQFAAISSRRGRAKPAPKVAAA